MNRKKGFTLIEMLVVIVIIGVIMAIAIPSVIKLMNRNSNDTCNVYKKLVESSIDLYALRNKGSLNNSVNEVTYETLKNKMDLDEKDLTCDNDAIIYIYKTNNGYTYKYNLTCKDKKGLEYKLTSESKSCN